MKQVVAVLSSDWHADRGAWKKVPLLRGDSLFGIGQLVDIAIAHGVPLIGAGDLFDSLKPETDVLAFVFRQVQRLAAAELSFWFTQGQHEKQYPPYLSLIPTPTHINNQLVCLPDTDINVFGLDHRLRADLPDALKTIPRNTDLVVCHQVWSEVMGRGDEGFLASIPYARMVLTGDFHKHQSMVVTSCSGHDMTVLSPGPVCLQDIAEERKKRCFLLYDDFSFESVALQTRMVFDMVMHTQDDLEAVLDNIDEMVEPDHSLPEELRKPIIYIQSERIPSAYARITEKINERAFLFWKILEGEERVVLFDEDERDERVPQGLVGCLELAVPKGTPVYDSLHRLLESHDLKSELMEIEKSFK